MSNTLIALIVTFGLGFVAGLNITLREAVEPLKGRALPTIGVLVANFVIVVDTSFFPTISAVNPALTTVANAIRVGDHVLERLR